MAPVKLAPSILAADFTKLGEELTAAVKGGATYIHFDVMDGHFVDNISFGIPVLASIAKRHPLINDVHIMISDPARYAARFVKAGADILTFHLEACRDEAEIRQVIRSIKDHNGRAGMSVKPRTPIELLSPYLDELALVLVMSVEPGFGGQAFDESALGKIAWLRQEITNRKLATLIEVDGGINADTGRRCVASGADILVAGSYLFGHADMISRMRRLLDL